MILNNQTPKFLWLHIKKCGGESFRKTFTPPYVQTERKKNGKCFIALPKEEWNDALNNYRLPLGEYDYKRMLFAKEFLYSQEEFEAMYKFVIVRNPYDRIVSAWKYLPWFKSKLGRPKRTLMKHSFEYFLNQIPELWESKVDRHIATHTAPIWSDITDTNKMLLVNDIFRLEKMDDTIDVLQQKLNVDVSKFSNINKSKRKIEYRKYYNKRSLKLVEDLYHDDIKNLNYQF